MHPSRVLVLTVDININLRITHLVHARYTRQIGGRRGLGPASGNSQLRALRVPLRLVRGMDSEQLVSEEVLSRWQRGGDGGCPGGVLIDELALAPCTGSQGAGFEAGLVDLELFEELG